MTTVHEIPTEESAALHQVREAEVKRAQEEAASGAGQGAPQVPAGPGGTAPPAPVVAFEATTPKEVTGMLEHMVNPVLKRRKVEPLSRDELDRGGEALAPCVNRYVPWAATNHPELCVAAMWVFGIVVVRWGAPAA